MALTGWDQLQPDLIESIANCLTAYIDYIRFRAVCVSWRSAVPKLPNHQLPTQIPWLMIPFFGAIITSRQGFFSLSENNLHILELPECSEKRVCGSSLGWLLMVGNGLEVDLFNPLTRTLIQLPPLSTFPNVESVPGKKFRVYFNEMNYSTETLEKMQNYLIRKMVLSSSPKIEDEDNYTVVVILQYGELAFLKKGDQVWTLLVDQEFSFDDVIFYKGQFFAVDAEGRVVVCDFDGPSPPKVTVISSGPVKEGYKYLVDCSGDLLLIRRTRNHNLEHVLDYTTSKFEVFKPDQNLTEWEWHEVKDLGDHVLFLGPNSSLSLVAHEFSGCQRNHIYFVDDFHEWQYLVDDDHWYQSNGVGAHDFGVFDLNDGSIKPQFDDLFRNWLIWPPPAWITPSPS